MSLLVESRFFKPFQYPWAFDAWKMQQQTHWLPEEVPMADDIKDWKHRLTTAEKNLCTQIFRLFTQMDIEVNDCYMTRYANIFKPTEIKMMLSAFSAMETIHVVAYSHLVETLGMPDEIYQDFMKYKEMKDKCEYLHQMTHDTPEGIATTLATFGAFCEGLQLFASFVILLNFTRFGKMKGMGQIITWSVRDETLHAMNIIKLYHEFLKENPQVNTPQFKKKIQNICKDIVRMEEKFVDLAFEIDGAVEGLSASEVKEYIKYIADRRLLQLGVDTVFGVKKNPLQSWLDPILNGVEHANFFEVRVTEYSKGATTGTWDEAFAMHEKTSNLELKIDEQYA